MWSIHTKHHVNYKFKSMSVTFNEAEHPKTANCRNMQCEYLTTVTEMNKIKLC